MSGFYQYDTRGASAADQIVNLERMVEERDAEIERLRGQAERDREAINATYSAQCDMKAEIERLRAAVRYAAQSIDAGVPILEVRDKLLEKINAS